MTQQELDEIMMKNDKKSISKMIAFSIRDYFIVNEQELPHVPDIFDYMVTNEARDFILYLASTIQDLLFENPVRDWDYKAVMKRRMLDYENGEGDFEYDVKMSWSDGGFVPKIKK